MNDKSQNLIGPAILSLLLSCLELLQIRFRAFVDAALLFLLNRLRLQISKEPRPSLMRLKSLGRPDVL